MNMNKIKKLCNGVAAIILSAAIFGPVLSPAARKKNQKTPSEQTVDAPGQNGNAPGQNAIVPNQQTDKREQVIDLIARREVYYCFKNIMGSGGFFDINDDAVRQIANEYKPNLDLIGKVNGNYRLNRNEIKAAFTAKKEELGRCLSFSDAIEVITGCFEKKRKEANEKEGKKRAKTTEIRNNRKEEPNPNPINPDLEIRPLKDGTKEKICNMIIHVARKKGGYNIYFNGNEQFLPGGFNYHDVYYSLKPCVSQKVILNILKKKTENGPTNFDDCFDEVCTCYQQKLADRNEVKLEASKALKNEENAKNPTPGTNPNASSVVKLPGIASFGINPHASSVVKLPGIASFGISPNASSGWMSSQEINGPTQSLEQDATTQRKEGNVGLIVLEDYATESEDFTDNYE
jgi:hypothetical protein